MAGQRNNYGKRMQSESDYSRGDGSKRRTPTDEKESNSIGPEDTVFRYLCPTGKIGSIIGVGGDIAKQLRTETNSKIRISETIPGCEERVVTIYSGSEETNVSEDTGDLISPAQDALFKVHDRVLAEELRMDEDLGDHQQITVRMLVPSDQIGCVIGKGGQVIQNLRSETGAQIRVLSSEHLPPCALNSDELLQITGEGAVVKKALYQVAARLHDNPSRSQHLLLSSPSIYRSGAGHVNPHAGAQVMGVTSLMGPYGSYKSDGRSRATAIKEFAVRLVCPTENVGAVIGKGGGIIKQLRQESGASIKVDSAAAEGDDCIIFVSAKEAFEDQSPTIDATMRLQPRSSEKTEKESGDAILTTRLLVPSSRVGCLIGKGGSIINEMRNTTRASIRILSKDNLPKVASEDDEMVQITGDANVAGNALLQVLMRLRANTFEMEGGEDICPSCYKEQANSWGWVRTVTGADFKRIYPSSPGLTRETVRQGSQWVTLTREFCEFMMSDPLARDYLVAFGTTFVPDESFIPTLLYTTEWNRTLFDAATASAAEKKQALMRHIVWTPGQWHPDVLKSKDLPKIFASNGLFARKFDPWASRVYEDIDFVIDSTVPEHSRYSTYNSTITIKKPDIDEENKNNNGEDNNGTGNNNGHGNEDVDVTYRKENTRSRRKIHFAGRSE